MDIELGILDDYQWFVEGHELMARGEFLTESASIAHFFQN